MCEQFLPPAILSKGTQRGNEYAWPLSVVKEVIAAAKDCGLANLGGQIQYRIPEGTCELYWLTVGSRERSPGESWDHYVSRSAEEVLTGFRGLKDTDFIAEGVRNFDVLKRLQMEGVDLSQYLCFVLYFEKDSDLAVQNKSRMG